MTKLNDINCLDCHQLSNLFLPRYPIIGSGPHLAPNLHVVISKMRRKFGKIFSLYLGNEPFVIVADFNLYKEAMAKEELLYRPKLGANDDFMFPDENGTTSLSF